MTDDQINQAIAKACGIVGKSGEIYKTPEGWTVNCPEYCSDLNAMHEAEKTIFPYYATVYSNKLAKVTGAEMSDDTDYFCATARQRAEAFLRTLGKWEEATDKDCLTVQQATTEKSSADHIGERTEMMRLQAAIAAMQGHIVHRGFSENAKYTADLAVRYADALILRLQCKEQQ